MGDIEFIPNKNNLANLDELSLMGSRLSEKRICELYEIAEESSRTVLEMQKDGFGIYEILSLISSGFSETELKIHEHHLPENLNFLASYVESFSLFDKASFTKLLLSVLSSKGITLTERDFFEKEERDESIAYVKNQLANEAYDVFSEEFSDPRLKYAADLKEAVSLVTKSLVGYAILPLEEKGGARLPTVSEIIFRNDFKINSVIPVFGPDGNADMKYALVSKNFTVPKRDADDDGYLEIRLDASSDNVLTEVFSAVDYFGMSVYRVNTVTFDTEGESETYFSVVIRDSGNNFAGLLTYFTLFIGDFVPVGIYKNLE